MSFITSPVNPTHRMLKQSPTHRSAVWLALLVTFLWSTSWVLIKFGLQDLPALTFAGLRYTLAFLCLAPFLFRPEARAALRRLTRADWLRLTLLGVLYYAVAQGTQFLGLVYLPAITASLLLNLSALFVTLMGIRLLREIPSGMQWVGMGLFFVGLGIYFYPVAIDRGQGLGVFYILLGVLANSASSVLGRSINREGSIPVTVVTTVSMGIGALLMLVCGIAFQGMPVLTPGNWANILWLAVVNTALAFTLWNYTLRTLSAMESSIINNTMMIQIAILAWLFLGEGLTWKTILGLAVSAVGILLVQWRRAALPVPTVSTDSSTMD